MIRALWFSRHDLTEEQKNGLSNYFKDTIETVQINKTVESAQQIVDIALAHRCNIIAAVLPVHLLSDLMTIAASNKLMVVIPRSKRVLNEDNTVKFVYDGWEIVEICIYSVREFK